MISIGSCRIKSAKRNETERKNYKRLVKHTKRTI